MPEVSVIIPTYNYARFLATAIRSVLGQTIEDIELIVVDDGSTDNTRDVVAQFESDRRVRYAYQKNQGDAPARVHGLTLATGRYLGFLDSDDYWLPEKLELQLAALRDNPAAGAVHSAVYLDVIDSEQRVIFRTLLTRPPLREKTLYAELLYRMIITGSHSSVVVPRAVLDRVGVFDPTLMSCDWDLWRRIAWEHEILYIDIPLSVLRRHGSNQTANPDIVADNSERILRKFASDIPLELRYHLPRMRLERYLKVAWMYWQAGRAGTAVHYLGKTLANAWRCPVFTARYLAESLLRKARRRWDRSFGRPTSDSPALDISINLAPVITHSARGSAPHESPAPVPTRGSPVLHTQYTDSP